jgi:hypothetical protein
VIQIPSLSTPPDAPQWGRTLATAINNCFAIVGSYLQRLWTSEIVEIDSPATADEPFIVTHNLGRTPKFAACLPAADGTLKATADDLREWTKDRIKVRFSTANTKLRIRID